MPNAYYNVEDPPENATKADANNEIADRYRLEAAFDMLPAPDALAAGAINFAATDTGVANAYIIDLPLVTSLYAGLWVLFPAANSNTGASVLNVSDLGNSAIRDQAGQPLVGDEIRADSIVSVIYTGAYWQLLTSGATYALISASLVLAQEAAAEAVAAAAEAAAYLAAMTQTPTFTTVDTDVIVVQGPATAETFSGLPIQLEIDIDNNVTVDWVQGTSFSLTLDQNVDELHFINMDVGEARSITVEIINTGEFLIGAFVPNLTWVIMKPAGSTLFPTFNAVTSYGCTIFPAERMHVFPVEMVEAV
jgi:hypothetical protein